MKKSKKETTITMDTAKPKGGGGEMASNTSDPGGVIQTDGENAFQ